MSNLYQDTIDILKERGHTQGKFVDEFGQVCLLGAFFLATGASEIDLETGHVSPSVYREELSKIISIIKSQHPVSYKYWDVYNHGLCSKFNDTHTTEEVIAILEKAAADA